MRLTLILALIGFLGVIGASAGKKDKCKLCRDLYNKGRRTDKVYTLRLWDPVAKKKRKVKAFCDMTNGGYTLFHSSGGNSRRLDGSGDFSQNWKSYKKGFGKKSGNYWLGNDNLHLLTSNCGPQSMRADMLTCSSGPQGQEELEKIYTTFQVGDEASSYKLNVSGGRGPLFDAFATHNGMRFSTIDVDNDVYNSDCANLEISGGGGWWYSNCFHVSPNGRHRGTSCAWHPYMSWHKAKKPNTPGTNWTAMQRMSLGVIDTDAIDS